jgi:thiol-disulfide isomerase/thioredoxin
MHKTSLFLFILNFLLFGCINKNHNPIRLGCWEGFFMLTNKDAVHVELSFVKYNDSINVVVLLGKDTCVINELNIKKDSIRFKLPLYDSEFKLKIIESNFIEGLWFNYNKGPDYKIPFFANFKIKTETDTNPLDEEYKKYKIIFNKNLPTEYLAIGLFKQKGDVISGTFATETGDYRYLSGYCKNNELVLNSFDGAHVFLFKGLVKNDSITGGTFLSGIHGKESWEGTLNDDFELTNADSITKKINDDVVIDFRLPNAFGDTVSWSDLQLKNKVVIIQIMGSWCPNCYDESVVLAEFYKKYYSSDLVIIPIAFETTSDFSTATYRLNKMFAKIGIKYNYLIGGVNDKKIASSLFPTLSEIKSFPTTIFIDKKRNVRKVHSGFYGPETGKYFSEYKISTENYIKNLLFEN